MSNQGPFDNNNNQFVISYELLHLFKWILEHELDPIKKIINRSLKKGLADRLTHPNMDDSCETNEDMQQYVVDFFVVLEALMHEKLDEQEVDRIIERNLIPAIDKIDITACDAQIVASSVAKATSTCEDKPHKDPKQILCKELLKRWKPSKTTTCN